MTEEIIIDGVNVAGCDFFAQEDFYSSYTGETQAYKGECGCSDDEMCKNIKNCCYKKQGRKLKRLEQENKELRREVAELRKDCNHCNFHTYRSALEEINILVKNYCNACDEFKVKTYKNKNDCLYCNYGFIKRKINEVLNESK